MRGIGSWSLREKMTLMITLLLVVSVLAIGGIVYYQSREMVVSSLGTQAVRIAENVAKMIDPEQYQDLLENGDENHPYYIELRESLNDLREKAGLLYLYTMQEKNGQYIYIVDGMPWDSDNVCAFGDEELEENISVHMKHALKGESVAGDLMNTDEWGKLLSAYVPIRGTAGQILGFIGGDYPAETVYQLLRESLLTILVTLAVILVVGIIAGYFVASRISKPLEELAEKSEQIRDGDLSVQFAQVERRDEIGRLYGAFADMVEHLRSLVGAIQGRYDELMKRVRVLEESTGSAEQSMAAIFTSVNDVARGSDDQLKDLNKAASEVSVMVTHIREIEGNSTAVRTLSTEAEERALAGREVLDATKKQVGQINQQAGESAAIIRSLGKQIDEVTEFITVISDIAQQTNLLALNAAIESARAGEEGRGFAVVAKEIRSLAEESGSAAQKVAQTIREIQKQSEAAVEAIEQTVVEVQSGVHAIQRADDQFGGVVDANRDVSNNIGRVAEAIQAMTGIFRQIESGMTGVSAVSEEANASAEEVAGLVERERANIQKIKDESRLLVRLAEDLRHEIEKFHL